MTPAFTGGNDLFGTWLADVRTGTPPKRYTLSGPFGSLDIRPGRLLLFGGAPGGGKTALLLQVGVDLLRQNPAARLLFANVEMPPSLLADRIVSRLSGVPLTAIADRTLAAEQTPRVDIAVASLASVSARLAFLNAPFSLAHVAAAGTAFDSNVVVLDYVQRFAAGTGGDSQREQLDAAAGIMRGFCDAGAAVLAASAVARQKGNAGSTYGGLNLASFRGSSELEYGCDAAYLHEPGEGGVITLKCEKNRYGPVADIVTRFDPATQTFSAAPSGLEGFDDATPAAAKGNRPKGG